jgi:hypothetical protein
MIALAASSFASYGERLTAIRTSFCRLSKRPLWVRSRHLSAVSLPPASQIDSRLLDGIGGQMSDAIELNEQGPVRGGTVAYV